LRRSTTTNKSRSKRKSREISYSASGPISYMEGEVIPRQYQRPEVATGVIPRRDRHRVAARHRPRPWRLDEVAVQELPLHASADAGAPRRRCRARAGGAVQIKIGQGRERTISCTGFQERRRTVAERGWERE